MRPLVGVLACIGLGGLTLVFADTPPAAPATSAPSTTTAAKETTPSPATAASTKATSTTESKEDADERQLIAQGYHAEMRHGEKLFCRREQELGSRLGGHLMCGTVAEIKAMTRASQDVTKQTQMIQTQTSGH